MKKTALLLTLILFFTFSGCKSTQNGNKNILAVSIAPQATFVSRVCGDKFDVVTVIPAGASPETYEPSPSQMTGIADAKLYFSIGVPAEKSSILPLVDSEKTVSLEDSVRKAYPDRLEGDSRDPHIWLSPKRVIVMVEAIADSLKELDPENADYYAQNAENYINELKELDEYISASLSDCKNRKFIAFHPAFGYFADDYALSMHALEEHGKEATAKRLAQMTDLAKKEDIKVIFYQAEASKKQALSFAEEIGGEAVMLEPLSADYINNLKTMTDSLLKAMK